MVENTENNDSIDSNDNKRNEDAGPAESPNIVVRTEVGNASDGRVYVETLTPQFSASTRMAKMANLVPCEAPAATAVARATRSARSVDQPTLLSSSRC